MTYVNFIECTMQEFYPRYKADELDDGTLYFIQGISPPLVFKGKRSVGTENVVYIVETEEVDLSLSTLRSLALSAIPQDLGIPTEHFDILLVSPQGSTEEYYSLDLSSSGGYWANQTVAITQGALIHIDCDNISSPRSNISAIVPTIQFGKMSLLLARSYSSVTGIAGGLEEDALPITMIQNQWQETSSYIIPITADRSGGSMQRYIPTPVIGIAGQNASLQLAKPEVDDSGKIHTQLRVIDYVGSEDTSYRFLGEDDILKWNVWE